MPKVKCLYCFEEFDSLEAIENHIRTKHSILYTSEATKGFLEGLKSVFKPPEEEKPKKQTRKRRSRRIRNR